MSEPSRRRARAAAAFLLLCACAASCRDAGPTREPSRLRIAVLPDRSSEELRRAYTPLVAYLAADLGKPCDLWVPDSYRQLLDEFAAGRIELALFGGFTFVLSARRSGAVPLVWRDVDFHASSVFLAAADDPRSTLEAFRGARFSFGSRYSTSAHLMPRHFLEERGLRPESFFGEVGYTRAQDDLAVDVRERRRDLVVASTAVIEHLYRNGDLRRGDFKEVWETPSYPDFGWAAPVTLPPSSRERIRDAFLALSLADPEQAHILVDAGAGGFLPSGRDDYAELEPIVDRLLASGYDLGALP